MRQAGCEVPDYMLAINAPSKYVDVNVAFEVSIIQLGIHAYKTKLQIYYKQIVHKTSDLAKSK